MFVLITVGRFGGYSLNAEVAKVALVRANPLLMSLTDSFLVYGKKHWH
jgi:hypothetical protein